MLLAFCLTGCANYRVVSEFAKGTQQVAAPVREELTFITATCVQQAGLRSGFERDPEFKRIDECRGTDQLLQALQRETVDVMDLYASALLALVDDKKFDLSADLQALTGKLAAVKTKSGSSPVSQAQAGALAKVLSLIADALLQKERQKGIRILVDASPDLADVGRSLSGFFRSQTAMESPYARLVRLTEAEAGAVSAALRSPFIVNADPIRSAELRLEQWKLGLALRERTRAAPSDVGSLMARAIDAWVASIPLFSEQALEPDPAALLERILAFRTQAIEARDAAQAAF